MSIIKNLIKTITLAVSVLYIASAMASEPQTSRIDLLRSERWWGLHQGDAASEPTPVEVYRGDPAANFTVSMLVSSKGRYIWNDSPMQIAFDGTTFSITAADKVQVQKGGRTLRDAYLVCRHKHFPPKIRERSTDIYALPIIETDVELGYMQSAESVIEYVERLNSIGIKDGIVVLADGWSPMDGSYDFDRNVYPDPRATIDQLHKMGFKVMLNISPYCSMSGRAAAKALSQGALLFDSTDKPYIVCQTQNKKLFGAYMVYDILQESVRGHIEARLKALAADYGVDGFRLDCDEIFNKEGFIQTEVQLPDGYLDAWFALSEPYDLVECVPSSPSNTDYVPSRIANVSPYVANMLALGLNGMAAPYATPTVNLRVDEAEELALLRALQQELMMPTARVPFAPWRITDERYYEEYMRDLVLRRRVGEHLREVAKEGAKTAEPMVRHLEYLFPTYGFADCKDQYMLGEDFLVAPISEGTKRTVRLPRGAWTDITGKKYRGPVVINFYSYDGRICCFEKN